MSVWNVAGIIVLSHLFVGELFRDGGTPNLATSRDPQTLNLVTTGCLAHRFVVSISTQPQRVQTVLARPELHCSLCLFRRYICRRRPNTEIVSIFTVTA